MTRKYVLLFISMLVLSFQQCGNPISIKDGNSASVFVVDQQQTSASAVAMTIHQRLGVKLGVDDPKLNSATQLILSQRPVDAAIQATQSDEFLNYVIRDFATKMSNREESAANPLNDFVATVIGIARDDRDAREMLTGGYFYYAPATGVVARNIEADVVRSNNHYLELDAKFINLARELRMVQGQKVIGPGDTMITLNDSAGVLTSRAFMSSHAIAGTNRRLVEFSFRQFLCAPISEWSNISIPDGYVGRDIGRAPKEQYKSKCVGCHAPMDAMRPAFAYFNFNSLGTQGYTEYMKRYPLDPRPTDPTAVDVPVPVAEQNVPSKFRRGKAVFPDGFPVTTPNWENFTKESLGWRGERSGIGLNAFGRMLSNSQAFSECMAMRAFKTVCYKDFPTEDKALLGRLVREFEASGYRLKTLFATVVADPACTGDEP